jgi:outer membrane protein assembly factor BamB
MSPWLLLAIALLLPPVGIVLLWTRTKAGFFRKLLGSFALLLLSVVHLVYFFELRVEFDGAVGRPIFSFGSAESHYDELEQSRSEQKSEIAAAPSPVPAVPAPTPEPEPVADVAPPAPDPDWPRFRGPRMDGHYEGEISTEWPEDGLPLLYKQPIGGGYASFVIADGTAFTIEQRRDQEVAAAYDLETGREIWTRAWQADFQETLGGDGPRATPTWDEGRLFVLGAEGHLEALEATTGDVLWERHVLEDAGAPNLTWGMSASPLIVDEKVILLPGGSNGSSVVAYHKDTGEILWKSLDDTQAYTSPILVELAGEPQLLVVGARRAMGVSPQDGALLWDHPWVTNQGINVAQPLMLGEDRVFLSAGYGHGAEVVEVIRYDAAFQARSVWSNTRMKNKFTSSVLHEGHIYGLDEAILACVEASTGELTWKGGRYGYGQLIFASGHLVVLTERGELALVKATPEGHEELAMFPAIEGKTWNHPAIADGVLLVRNANEMAAFRIAP